MSQSDKPDEDRQDPADALASMAESGQEQAEPVEPSGEDQVDATVALDQMADDDDAVVDLDDLVDAEGETIDLKMAEVTGVSGRQAFEVRRAHGARMSGQQARVHAHAYKRMMIPLLLAVGAVLIIIGAIGLSMMLRAAEPVRQTRWHSWLTGVVLVSFPLGAIMFFGAWLFHREVKR